jgi:hypothetical protein
LVNLVSPLNQLVDILNRFLPVFFRFYGINCATRASVKRVLEFRVFAEPASIAQERILLVIIDRSAFVALENVFAAIAANSRIGRDARAATRALQRFRRSLGIFYEVRVLDHQIAGNDRQREFHFDFGLVWLQNNFLGLVPHGWSVFQFDYRLNGSVVIIDVDHSNHFGPLNVGYFDQDFRNRVAVDQFHYLGCRSEPRIDFDRS